MAAQLGIGHKVLFTGFLRGDDVERVFQMADLYVMPSVSEPFGIAPLEALSNDVPVIISKQSGVSEVLTHALKVDFWDVDEMANKIVAVLQHPPLQMTLAQHGNFEVRKLRWRDSARALPARFIRRCWCRHSRHGGLVDRIDGFRKDWVLTWLQFVSTSRSISRIRLRHYTVFDNDDRLLRRVQERGRSAARWPTSATCRPTACCST